MITRIRDRNNSLTALLYFLIIVISYGNSAYSNAGEVLSGTSSLEMEGDIASAMVSGIDSFLLRQLDEARIKRFETWNARLEELNHEPSGDIENKFDEFRNILASQLGVIDERINFTAPSLSPPPGELNPVIEMDGCHIIPIEWPVIGDVCALGYLVLPENDYLEWVSGKSVLTEQSDSRRGLIVIPDAGESGESILGLDGEAKHSLDLQALCRSGIWTVVTHTVSRDKARRQSEYGGPASRLTHREYLHRAAFEMGRTLAGYEIQSVLSLVDWFASLGKQMAPTWIGVIGYGEGGMISMYSGALDKRISLTGVSGYFSSGIDRWRSPLDRNIFGLFEEFGDAETGILIWPRRLVLESRPHAGEVIDIPGEGGAPAQIQTPSARETAAEWRRLKSYTEKFGETHATFNLQSDSQVPLTGIIDVISDEFPVLQNSVTGKAFTDKIPGEGYSARDEAMIKRWDEHTQKLLIDSPWVRTEFTKDLDTSSIEKYLKTSAEYRKIFEKEIIGSFEQGLLSINPRSRLKYIRPGWKGWEVMLDVYPEVFAYGILCVPDNIPVGEKRPVVVCQHGLEGRPQDIIEGDHYAYHDFAAKLTERGYITFSPQNPYIFGDRFRTLQRKANPIGKSLFSIITPQHRQILNWLKTLSYVDEDRIAFYGLSYGGKTAMRVPAIIEDYCLSICSADFNDWVWKNASTKSPYSYVWTGEYEIFEFNLGHTFNYSDMAALIAPRPFMVERGHFDGVAPDEKVASEFAKVRHLYQARLNLEDRCEIEWFSGPHTINGKGTFEFLDRFLKVNEGVIGQ